MGFCRNALEAYPISQPILPDNIGIIKLIIGILYMTMVGMTIFWIHRQEKMAQSGDEIAVKSVIFPVFTKLMWLSAFSSFYVGVLLIFIPVNITSSNNGVEVFLYPLAWTFQHAVIEGISFMLMQKGCGSNAAKRAGAQTCVWCLITFIMQVGIYYYGGIISILIQALWSMIMLAFYWALWKLPRNRLFRRPAAIMYAQFWFWFRVMVVVVFSLAESREPHLSEVGSCAYVFGPLLLFALLQPGLSYWCLLQDSRWWQGLAISQGTHRLSTDTLLSPLLGADISLHSAQTLAYTMDELGGEGGRLLNFANIFLDKSRVLGHGSFSKVYGGCYQGKPCAIKLIFTLDLTQDVIQRVAAEASILSAAKDPNVVKIYGVSVLPPSVCIVLELCSYGSLAFVLRGDTGDIFHPDGTPAAPRRPSLRLSLRDRIFLAMGCARGLSAVHSLGTGIAHRDVKSFNFLVDNRLNAKLADLEMGGDNGEDTPDQLGTDDILVNWVAPEVLRGFEHTQSSDVYSLSLVLWEILSCKIPFLEESGYSNNSHTIKAMIIAGYRPPIPTCPSVLSDLIGRGWSDSPEGRCTGLQMATDLNSLWQSMKLDELEEIDSSLGITSTVCKFLSSKNGVVFSKIIANYDPPQHLSHSLSTASGNIPLTSTTSDSFVWAKRVQIDRHMSFCVGDGIDAATANELATMFTVITNNPYWQVCESVGEALVIVSAQAPHIILKSSTVWSNMMGYSPQQIFGHCLDHYTVIANPVEGSATEGGGISHAGLEPTRDSNGGKVKATESPLTEFYEKMRTEQCAHTVATLVQSSGETILFSIHSYAISGVKKINVGIGPDGEESEGSKGNASRSSSVSSYRSSNDSLNRTDTLTSNDSRQEIPTRTKLSTGGIFSQLSRHSSHTFSRNADFYALYLSPLDAHNESSEPRSVSDTKLETEPAFSNSFGTDPMTPELRRLGLASDC